MESEKTEKLHLIGFMADQKQERNFEEYMRKLLSTFMPEKYLQIYMSREVHKVLRESREQYGSFLPEAKPAGVSSTGEMVLSPFDLIRRAFMHRNVSTISLENLETLGDVVLNEAAVMIIVTNWPNLLNQAGQVADMKRYYTNNTNVAEYAKDLGFIRWIARTKDQGLNSKERADVFESFIGALVLVGEFYIGDQMGLVLARRFLNKFLATRNWYPEDPDFYMAPSNLWNDYKTSLPGPDSEKPFLKPKKDPYETRDEEGLWHLSFTVQDPKGVENGLVKKATGRSYVKFSAVSRNKEDAKTELYQKLVKTMKLNRSDITYQRKLKRDQDSKLKDLMNELNEFAVSEAKRTGRKQREFEVPAKQQRGGKTFIFIREIKHEIVGDANFPNRELTYGRTIASGVGTSEEEALKDAIHNLKTGKTFLAAPGTDESHIWNPDNSEEPEIITAAQSRKQREEKETTTERSEKTPQRSGKSAKYTKSTGREKTPKKSTGTSEKYSFIN